MRRLSLSEWASLAEVVGTVAVVISLVFVVLSVNRNTAELRATNDAFLYEQSDSMTGTVAADPALAERYANKAYGLEFSDPVEAQIFWSEVRELNMWEAAYYWYLDGLFSSRQWAGWDQAFIATLKDEFPEDWWRTVRKSYSADFAKHVDRAYASE